MSWKILLCTGLLCVVASSAWADPEIRVIHPEPDGNNQRLTANLMGGGAQDEWIIQVLPDGPLLWSNPGLGGAEGGSVDVEIDVTFPSMVTMADPSTDLSDQNPGNNPFTDTTTTGIAVDGATVFAAVGGPDGAADLFMPFPGDTNMDNRTNGDDFTTLSGFWDPLHMCGTGGFPACPAGRADADFDGNGFVDGDDFTSLSGKWLQGNWIDVAYVTTESGGGTATWGGDTVTPAGGGDPYTSSRVAQAGSNFDGLSGSSVAGAGSLGGGGAVPEPASLLLLVGGALMLGGCRLRR